MTGSSENRDPLARIADDIVQRLRRGEDPSVEEYVRAYPELAEEIRDLYPTLRMMEDAKQGDGVVEDLEGVVLNGHRIDRLGDFRVLRLVGEGGMGVVFEAMQLSLGRHVALKVLSPHSHLRPRYLDRFLQESRAAARLHHTNIVPVFGVGEDKGFHYYAMQFIRGLSLDKVLDELKAMRKGPQAASEATGPLRRDLSYLARCLVTGEFTRDTVLNDASEDWLSITSPEVPPVTAESSGSETSAISFLDDTPLSAILKSDSRYFHSVAQIGVQVAEALGYAHEQGTLHRDIKPSNLVLDGNGRIWVTDFGLAKSADDESLTQPGDVVGTLRYIAPERFKGDSDARCDVYGLGLTLYELIALRPAFKSHDRTHLIRQITEGKVRRLRSVRPEVSRDLERIVMRAIDREPAFRYQGAAEMAADLRCFLEDRPIPGKRTLLLERVWRWSRRNPVVASLSAAVLILMVVLTVGSFYTATSLKKKDEAWVQQLAAGTLTAPAADLPYILDTLQSREDTGWREPALRQFRSTLADPGQRSSFRLRSAVVLTALGEPQREFLFASIPEAPAHECGNVARALRAAGGESTELLVERARRERDLEARARMALVLIGLGDDRVAREMLAFEEDPLPRTTLIHVFRDCHPSLADVPDMLRSRDDPAFRSGMITALATIEPETLPAGERDRLEAVLLDLYQEAPSGGTHSAAGWALGRWKVSLPEIPAGATLDEGRRWFVNAAGGHMVGVPAGKFVSGDASTPHATPRPVFITRDFYMLDREVPVRAFQAFLDDPDYPSNLKPRDWPGPDKDVSPDPECPVQKVSFSDIAMYCNWLSRKDGREPCYVRLGENRWRCRFEANGYRLPTEAEWERAARAGTSSSYYFGDDVKYLAAYARARSQRAWRAGTRAPSAWGFFDLLGNVWERCWDVYSVPYPNSPPQTSMVIDPVGLGGDVSGGGDTVIRGGGVGSGLDDFRSARRSGVMVESRERDSGFRVVCAEGGTADDGLVSLVRDEGFESEGERRDAWRAIRRWYVQHGQAEEGARALSRALRETPLDADLRAEYGNLLATLCRWNEAALEFEAAGNARAAGSGALFQGGWWMSGVYSEDLAASFPPERDSSECPGAQGEVYWQPVLPSDGDFLQLDALCGRLHHISLYVLTYVYALRDQDAMLLVGSDDRVRVWINGGLVHEYDTNREGRRDSDQVPVKLRRGWNRVLAKVTNHTVGYVLYLRFSEDPLLGAMAYAKRGDWHEAEQVLAAAIEAGGGTDHQLLLAHARALAGLFRFGESEAEFLRALALEDELTAEEFRSGWWVVGPYPCDLETAFPPEEDPDPRRPARAAEGDTSLSLEWQATCCRREQGVLSLGSIAETRGQASTVYALTYVYSRSEEEVVLLVGGEDRAIVWINGERVHEYPEFPLPWRAVPVQDRVLVTLRAGWNHILCKVAHPSGTQKLNLALSRDPLERDQARTRDEKLVEEYYEVLLERYARQEDPKVWMRLGDLLARMGEWDKAEYSLSRAADLGASSRTLRYLIMARLAGDRPVEAATARAELLMRLVTARPSTTKEALLSLWTCTLCLGDYKDVGLLLRLARSAVKENEEDPLALTVLGATHFRAGEYDAAIDALQRAEARSDAASSPPAYTWYLMAMVLGRRPEESEEAYVWLDKAIRWTDDALGRCAVAEGDDQAALTWTEKVTLHRLRKEAEAFLSPPPRS